MRGWTHQGVVAALEGVCPAPVAMLSSSSGSQRVIPGAAASPGNALQMQSLRPASVLLSQKLGNVFLAAGVLMSPTDEFDVLSSLSPLPHGNAWWEEKGEERESG